MRDLRVPISPDIYEEAREWCMEHFGDEHTEYNKWRGLANNEVGGDFYFVFEEDAVAFKLRWS